MPDEPRTLDEYLEQHDPADIVFQPSAHYNADGDEIHVFWSDAEGYAMETDNHAMSVLSSFKTNIPVGVTVYNVASLGLVPKSEVNRLRDESDAVISEQKQIIGRHLLGSGRLRNEVQKQFRIMKRLIDADLDTPEWHEAMDAIGYHVTEEPDAR